jgi:hypothetical protein
MYCNFFITSFEYFTLSTQLFKFLTFQGQLGQGQSVKFQSKPMEIKDVQEKIANISVGENTSAAVTGFTNQSYLNLLLRFK